MTEPRITAVPNDRRVNATRSLHAANAMLYRLSACVTRDQMNTWLREDASNNREWGALGLADQTAVQFAYRKRREVMG